MNNSIKSFSASSDHILVIDEYGNLWAWGCNDEGQLGNGGVSNASYFWDGNNYPIQTIPVQVKAGIKEVLLII